MSRCRVADERVYSVTVEAVRQLERIIDKRGKLPDGLRRNLAYRLRQVARSLDLPKYPPPPLAREPSPEQIARGRAMLGELKRTISGEPTMYAALLESQEIAGIGETQEKAFADAVARCDSYAHIFITECTARFAEHAKTNGYQVSYSWNNSGAIDLATTVHANVAETEPDLPF